MPISRDSAVCCSNDFVPITGVPPLWGSGGDVDGMSQWVCTDPDPVRVSLILDELEAMGRAFEVPRGMYLCIQSICYRSKTAPAEVKVDRPPAWLSREPDARFITVAPDHLQEAMWLAAAHRLDCLATHGYGSLVEASAQSYRYTNPESRDVFKRMVHRVLRLLGPIIKAVPERRPDLVILESFTSQDLRGVCCGLSLKLHANDPLLLHRLPRGGGDNLAVARRQRALRSGRQR